MFVYIVSVSLGVRHINTVILEVKTISFSFFLQAYCEKNRRLELRFRPDDVFCKPACGDKHQVSAVLLKVKVKRKKTDNQIISTKASVVGKVKDVFKFNSECLSHFLNAASFTKGSSLLYCLICSFLQIFVISNICLCMLLLMIQ